MMKNILLQTFFRLQPEYSLKCTRFCSCASLCLGISKSWVGGRGSFDFRRSTSDDVIRLSLVQLCSGILQCRFLIPKLSIHQLSKIVRARARRAFARCTKYGVPCANKSFCGSLSAAGFRLASHFFYNPLGARCSRYFQWWACLESNQGPRPYQGRALTN